MNVYPVPWAKNIHTEAYKFWFYGLALSVMGGFWLLLSQMISIRTSTSQSKKKGEKKTNTTDKSVSVTGILVKRVLVDGCDLLIPGEFLGWTRIGNEMVGMAMVLSTVVGGREIWMKASE